MSTSIDALVDGAQAALAEYASFTQEQVDHIVRKASVAALHVHGELATMAVEETGRGLFEDKAVKNMFACEHVTNSIINQKTVGVISHDEITGITEIADPVGVICALTPVTNPTSTAIFKSLIALKTRNPIVFGFHPSAQKSSAEAVVRIQQMAAAIQLQDGPARLTAPRARYDMDTEKVRVDGPIAVRAPNNYALNTSSADVDLKTRQLTSTAPVTGTVRQGNFSANSMSADLESRTVRLNGNARLRIVPGQTK